MLSDRLRFARESLGLRQADAAGQLGIAESGICEMEAGRREPKAAQLAALAQLYRRPIDFFFSNELVAQDVALWRARPADAVAEKKIRREFFALCENYQSLEELLGISSASHLPEETIPKDDFGFQQAERLAARIWEQFDLGAAPATSLRFVLEERFFVKVFALPLASETSAASTRSHRFGPAVLLNSDSMHWRRNFDLAHELFHLLTWRVFRDPTEVSSVESGEEEERLANAFASHLLLPEGPFRERLDPFLDKAGSLSISEAQLQELARSFDVSAEAIVYRCAGLFHWRKEQTLGIVEKVHMVRTRRESEPIEMLPSRYMSLTVQAYRTGLISYKKGAEYLRRGFRQARDILEPPEDGAEPDRQITVTAD
jgi:Zn-dependent peptidase ImmA (M78 family)/DNA-binding XRE family transcriptional regulator